MAREKPSVMFGFISLGFILAVLGYAAVAAFRIRTYAIDEYGRLIHEFDPWFNYRATEYLAEYGVAKFFKW